MNTFWMVVLTICAIWLVIGVAILLVGNPKTVTTKAQIKALILSGPIAWLITAVGLLWYALERLCKRVGRWVDK